jgi:hypothetical protein
LKRLDFQGLKNVRPLRQGYQTRRIFRNGRANHRGISLMAKVKALEIAKCKLQNAKLQFAIAPVFLSPLGPFDFSCYRFTSCYLNLFLEKARGDCHAEIRMGTAVGRRSLVSG